MSRVKQQKIQVNTRVTCQTVNRACRWAAKHCFSQSYDDVANFSTAGGCSDKQVGGDYSGVSLTGAEHCSRMDHMVEAQISSSALKAA